MITDGHRAAYGFPGLKDRGWRDKGVEPHFKKYDYDKAVVIMRAEPPHLGHMHLLRQASDTGKDVIILLGSRNRARSIKNPWRVDEREIMLTLAIEECVPELVGRFKIIGIADHAYNDQHWVKEVGLQVARELYTGHKAGTGFVNGPRVCLVGHKKDASSFYLNMFKQWDFINVEPIELMHATDVRELYFSSIIEDFIIESQGMLPHSVISYMCDWASTEEYSRLVKEWAFIDQYKLMWRVAPYAPTFVTTDAVIIESGHVLMIQRGGQPGNGQWALPGGFLDAAKGERIRDCVRRELVEETKIDAPPAMLLDLFKKAKSDVFDHPDRDLRGRIITHGFIVELPTRASGLTKVKGSDDAAHAQWIPLYEIEGMSEEGMIFSDHADIIFNLTGKI